MNLTFDSLKPYLIAQGSERYCFRHPQKDNWIIKLSPESKSKQTLREIKYFKQLKDKNIEFSHIPNFGKTLSIPGYIGFEQELITDYDGTISKQLFYYLDDKNADPTTRDIMKILEILRLYIYKNNILVCDLGGSNIVIQKFTPEKSRAVIVDGFGDTDFIPVCSYIPFLAKLKAHRRWKRFIQKFIPPHFLNK